MMPKKALSGSSNGMYRGVGLDICMEGKRVKGLRERSKLLSNRSQFRLLVGKDIVESGIVTGSGKLLISGENLGGGGVCGKGKYESISVAFPMFQNAMNNNVLGFAKFVDTVISEAASIIVLVHGLGTEVTASVTSSSNKIPLINHSSAKRRAVESANWKETRRLGNWNMKVAKTFWSGIRATGTRNRRPAQPASINAKAPMFKPN